MFPTFDDLKMFKSWGASVSYFQFYLDNGIITQDQFKELTA
ncbi:hypothetical protein OKN36_15820 [Furfurilactobacillus sp. OKN36]